MGRGALDRRGGQRPAHPRGRRDSVQSLLEHRTYIEALTQQDPERYCRTFLTGMVEAAAEQFDGRPAVTFEVLAH